MLTASDIAVLKALTWKVRVSTLVQLDCHGLSARRARRLARLGFLEPVTVLARPLLSLEAPAIDWSPGNPEPHFGKASYRLKRRWTEPPRPTRAFVATERAAALLGGRGGPLRHPLQATHDLHLGQVLIHYLRTAPADAAAWIGEDAIPRSYRPRGGWHQRRRTPDALVLGPDGFPRYEEFGGSYGPERLVSIHETCRRLATAYRVW